MAYTVVINIDRREGDWGRRAIFWKEVRLVREPDAVRRSIEGAYRDAEFLVSRETPLPVNDIE